MPGYPQRQARAPCLSIDMRLRQRRELEQGCSVTDRRAMRDEQRMTMPSADATTGTHNWICSKPTTSPEFDVITRANQWHGARRMRRTERCRPTSLYADSLVCAVSAARASPSGTTAGPACTDAHIRTRQSYGACSIVNRTVAPGLLISMNSISTSASHDVICRSSPISTSIFCVMCQCREGRNSATRLRTLTR